MIERDGNGGILEDVEGQPSGTGVYTVDGFIFRVSLAHLYKWAEVLRDGGWKQVFLTGEDVVRLLGPRELSPDEVRSLPA